MGKRSAKDKLNQNSDRNTASTTAAAGVASKDKDSISPNSSAITSRPSTHLSLNSNRKFKAVIDHKESRLDTGANRSPLYRKDIRHSTDVHERNDRSFPSRVK
ncbi:unnamed protein product [Oppiella nova]|uniref:Uncharacterized protein n=1 Tax=Oppiella nova TaxID=334625 RepID=A0A7R9LXK9_9ACAR|nr:unnamed protein product [Oppiella nova]CAG2167981.1 unnamed protein product [Oppiella nova]